MNCFTKHSTKKEKKYWKENCIHPLSLQPVNHEFIDTFRKEVLYCGGCKIPFPIHSNELKIHCNICNQFFHCNIAGECLGEDCKILKSNGEFHRAKYCRNCVSQMIDTNTCICNDCYPITPK
tara:strand:+ start:1545 stop:1910 length:366 start_codon:yes stop_codon:yes gene_type:complete